MSIARRIFLASLLGLAFASSGDAHADNPACIDCAEDVAGAAAQGAVIGGAAGGITGNPAGAVGGAIIGGAGAALDEVTDNEKCTECFEGKDDE